MKKSVVNHAVEAEKLTANILTDIPQHLIASSMERQLMPFASDDQALILAITLGHLTKVIARVRAFSVTGAATLDHYRDAVGVEVIRAALGDGHKNETN